VDVERVRRLTPVQALVVGFIAGLFVALALALFRQGRAQGDLVLRVEPVGTPADVTVYVGGAVERPGLYTLAAGSRLADAVERAVPLASADVSRVPLAERLRDGQSIIVPERSSHAPGLPSEAATEAPVSRLIDLNTAPVEELQTLPGIGPVLAQRIVQYREEHGPFRSVDELAKVRGISPRMVDELRDLVTAGGAP
jgi:competence protein ComEA